SMPWEPGRSEALIQVPPIVLANRPPERLSNSSLCEQSIESRLVSFSALHYRKFSKSVRQLFCEDEIPILIELPVGCGLLNSFIAIPATSSGKGKTFTVGIQVNWTFIVDLFRRRPEFE